MATKHHKECVFKSRIEEFDFTKRNRPSLAGNINLSEKQLVFIGFNDAYTDIKFFFCPECGAKLKASPYTPKKPSKKPSK